MSYVVTWGTLKSHRTCLVSNKQTKTTKNMPAPTNPQSHLSSHSLPPSYFFPPPGKLQSSIQSRSISDSSTDQVAGRPVFLGATPSRSSWSKTNSTFISHAFLIPLSWKCRKVEEDRTQGMQKGFYVDFLFLQDTWWRKMSYWFTYLKLMMHYLRFVTPLSFPRAFFPMI